MWLALQDHPEVVWSRHLRELKAAQQASVTSTPSGFTRVLHFSALAIVTIDLHCADGR